MELEIFLQGTLIESERLYGEDFFIKGTASYVKQPLERGVSLHRGSVEKPEGELF